MTLDTPHSVREITDHIRDLFEADATLGDIWITGEVLQSTVSRSGHVFFTLADDGAQLQCVLFRMNALRQRSLPSAGSACAAHGRIEVYPTSGTYQFYVDLVEEAGIGLAALEFELLRQQLEAEGLFSETRKRPLPLRPAVIGVVTSSSGSVWHDIQNVVRRRFPFVTLLLAPATVQGDTAPETVIAALQSLILDGRSEAIIIARGGGSASDLAAFNDENLNRAVFAAPVPVISAIGHETDWTLLDLVADVRAPTPSAAAELITPSIESVLSVLTESLALHMSRFERQLTSDIVDVDRLTARLDRLGPTTMLPRLRAEFEALESATTTLTVQTLRALQEQIALLDMGLSANTREVLTSRAEQTDRAVDLLQALSPTRTMTRGYAFVEYREDGRPLKSAVGAVPGDHLRTRFLDGSIESVVSNVSDSAS